MPRSPNFVETSREANHQILFYSPDFCIPAVISPVQQISRRVTGHSRGVGGM